ncbi:MAG: TolC family protein, partial [Chlamydiota bacterium]
MMAHRSLRRSRIIPRILLLFVAGCAQIPQHELARMPDSCGEGLLSEALNSGDFEIGHWPKASWWEDFKDPVLTELICTALEFSPTLKRAESNLKAAAQFALQKRARLFPELDFDADTDWQHLAKDGLFRSFAPVFPTVINDINLGLSFSYEFDFWGKNRDLFRAALDRAAALAAEAAQAKLIITTSIAYTYAELQFLLCKQHLLQQIESNQQAILDIRAKRELNALDPAILGLQSKSNVLDATAPLLDIEQQIRQHIHKLKALSGLGQGADLEIHRISLNPLQV